MICGIVPIHAHRCISRQALNFPASSRDYSFGWCVCVCVCVHVSVSIVSRLRVSGLCVALFIHLFLFMFICVIVPCIEYDLLFLIFLFVAACVFAYPRLLCSSLCLN